ncbi:MAG TPA: toll/interleukin-1 receptor domain-containing protein [Ktedonobacteraceae bacterium]|nr:toll/interleukin-1 receptor domain-containing protein [Ktedonobacteraceae bacterium]
MTSAPLQDPYVFISYSRLEEVFAKRLEQDLRAHGLRVWRDEPNITPGSSDWEASIRNAISHAYAVVLIASPSVIKSLYIKGELNLAKRYLPRRIYPVWIEGTDWLDCVPLDFINTQYIDMRKGKYETGLNTLVNVLKTAEASSEQDTAIDRQDIVNRQQKAYLPVSRIDTTSSARKFSRTLPLTGATVAIVLFAIIGGTLIYWSYAHQTTSKYLTSTVTPTQSASPTQLNQSYVGTTRGFANGSITFSLISEDQQGNVSLEVIFMRSDNNKQANYNCQGKVTKDRHITLHCSQIDAQNFLLDIEGVIFQDGHMQGTMAATDSSDSSYHHNYTWNVK